MDSLPLKWKKSNPTDEENEILDLLVDPPAQVALAALETSSAPDTSSIPSTSSAPSKSKDDNEKEETVVDLDFDELSSDYFELNKLNVLISGVSNVTQLKYYTSSVLYVNDENNVCKICKNDFQIYWRLGYWQKEL